MVDYKAIQDKWQQKWKENKVFEASVDQTKEKFFITCPYPYISGSLHIGHARVVTETDVYSRFLRMRGKNVLYPMAFHISGMPVLGISLAIEKGDPKKIELYENYVRAYITDEKEVKKIVKSFVDPWKIVEFFIPKMVEEYSTLGLGIDWRRRFTSGDIEHQKLVEWQFHQYKKNGYLVQGKHPVLYSKSLNNAVGEDDIKDGDTHPVEKNEFTLIKFPFEDGFIIAATLRPETMFGQTNMWVNPNIEYVKADVNGETWYISSECAEKLSYQDRKIKEIGKIKGSDLLGKTCKAPFINRDIMILPSLHCDPKIATGLVTSVPSDAPFDYIALKELQDSKKLCEKYGIENEKINLIKLIPIIQSKGYSQNAAIDACQKFKITSLKQKEKLDKATGEVYKAGFHTGKMLESCGKFANLSVREAKEAMKKELLDSKNAEIFYEVSRPAQSRDGGEIIVAILDNQWFLDFNAKGWKQKTNKLLKNMEIVPEKYRKQFEDVFDWLDKRPCARKRGIGTKFPFDKEWVIESLSDSTIYMSLYTIKAKLLEHNIDGNKLTPAFFDYVYLGEGDGKNIDISKDHLDDIKKSFDYWYPNNHRHTFSAHLSNHLSFMLFAHTACFPEEKWPQKFSFHGMVLSEGSKMSKSKGNVVSLLSMNNEFGADTFRAFLCSSTSVESSMDWKGQEAAKTKKHLFNIYTSLVEMNNNRSSGDVTNKAFVSKIERSIKKATEALQDMNLRVYSTVVLYDIAREYNKVLKKGKDITSINNYLFDRWVRLLTPLVPHYAEDLWEQSKGEGFVSLASWPEFDENKIDEKAEFVEDTIMSIRTDVIEIQKLAKIETLKSVKIIIADDWKFDFIKKFKETYAKDKNIGTLMKTLSSGDHAKTISKLIQNLAKNPGKIPMVVLTQKEEVETIKDHKTFLEKELGCSITIEMASESEDKKAGNAMPSKPAIVVS
jgi:leucyl-tRNA synthetase